MSIINKIKNIAISGVFSFSGIGLLSAMHKIADNNATLLLGSFGATAVLLYGFPKAPFSQPKNVIGGHMIAATIGITTYKCMELGFYDEWLMAPISVATSLMLMQATNTAHPPAGGTALIATMGLGTLGYPLLIPTLFGSTTLVASSYLLNNLIKERKYPNN